jgi:hypothetical protein
MLLRTCSAGVATDSEEAGENERPAKALTGVTVRLRQAGCSVRKTETIRTELAVKRCICDLEPG